MPMLFDFDSNFMVYVLAATSTVLAVEAIYLWCASTASYRGTVNRRLRLMKDAPDRQSILVLLRRERGLTEDGLYGLPVHALNRLVVQSGLTIGIGRLALGVAVGAVLLFAALLWTGRSPLDAAGATLVAALVLPLLVLKMRRRRRHAKFGAQFADAIDIMVRSLRAGHPIPVAIAMVARELPDPMGTEFGMVSDEVAYGADLETAMRNLAFRVGQADLPLFVTAVAIQGTTGGNLSEILQNLSSVIRQRFKMRRKVKALASEARFSAFFLSGLPIALFVIMQFTSPDFYGSVWHEELTRIGLGAAAGWMLIGNLVMYRMVNFRI